jgi:hypothetical protein
MARDKATLQNIDNSDPANYLNGRIKDNTGAGGGTPVNERVYGDFHQLVAKLMNLAGLDFNNLPENETNGYQFIDSLRSLATKNDLIYDLGKSGSILTLPVRLGRVVNSEIIRAKAGFDKGTEASIRGTLDNANKAVTYLGDFKQDEYVRLINTASGVLIIREVDAFNLGTVIDELLYLKAGTQAQENAGTINTVATTPLINKTAFTKRVIGSDSGDYLATAARNGLLTAAQFDIIAGIGSPALRNRGRFVLGNVGGSSVGTNFVSNGDISAVVAASPGNITEVDVTFSNTMDSTIYKVDVSVQSLGNMNFDNDIKPIPFKIVNTTKVKLYIEKTGNVTTNLVIHVDVIQL